MWLINSLHRYFANSSKLALALLLSLTLIASAADSTETESDETAIALLQQAGQVLQDSNSFSVQINTSDNLRQGDLRQLESDSWNFIAAKPNRFSFRSNDDWSPVAIICDGQQNYVYQGIFHQYFTSQAKADFAQLFNSGSIVQESFFLLPIAKELLTGDFVSSASEQNMTITSLGQQQLDDQTLTGVRLATETTDYDLWFSQNSPVILRQMTVDWSRYIASMRAVNANMPELSMVQQYSFDNWQFDTTIDDDAFAVAPPAGADKVLTFGQQPPRHSLVGRRAIDFELNFLDDTTRQLSEDIGNKVIVLDFWAVRCPPCREGLPLLTELTNQYRQDVVFYAVNVEDSVSGINRFFQDAEIEPRPTVVRDVTRQVGNRYSVSGIPQTVLIGKDGIIQAVHVGFSPAIETQIAAQLPALVAGQNLVSPPAESRRADVACSNLRLTPSTLEVGQTATVSFDLTNNGPDTLDPGMYVALFFLNRQEALVWPGDQTLEPGQELTVQIPAEQWACEILSPGEYSLRAAVLGYEQLQDRNSNNNNTRTQITVVNPEQ